MVAIWSGLHINYEAIKREPQNNVYNLVEQIDLDSGSC